jgi:hypothetical protein
MYKKYFNFRDNEYSFYPLSEVKANGSLYVSDLTISEKTNYYINIHLPCTKKPFTQFIYSDQSLRDKVFNELKKIKKIKD